MKNLFLVKCIYISFTILCTVNFTLEAQKVEGDPLIKLETVKMPESYKNPDGTIEKKGAPRAKTGDPIWIVYSDRDQNQTYTDRNCQKPFTKINFMQSFVVAEETDNEIRLVAFDPSSTPTEERKKGVAGFKASAEDQGWIKKKNMLLWSTSVVDDSTKYSKKAISVKKLEKGGGLKNLITKGILDLYNYPEPKSEFDNKKDIRLFQYLFVLKEDKEKSMVLLSKTNKTNPSNASDDVLGWASLEQIHLWDNALCLRINFEDAAIEERKEKKVDVQFFATPDNARTFRDGGKPDHLPFVYSESEKNENDNPYYYGFPIIGYVGKDNNIFKTGYVTNTVDKNGISVFSASKQAKLNEKYEDLQSKKENINIVFVLDGASRNFFKTLNAAINDNALIGNATMTRNKYKLGAIIYNDAKGGEESFKTISLSSNKDDFMEKLRVQGDKVLTSPINRDQSGAPVYEAVRKACDLFNNSGTYNIIVMTGSTTDPDKSVKPEALKQLIAKQVKMYFYQLANKDGSLYDQYIKDCRYFLEETANAIDEKYFKEEIQNNTRLKAKLSCPDESCKLVNSGVPGAFFSKDAGESFKAEEVKKKTQRIMRDVEDNLNALVSQYDRNTVNVGKSTVQVDEESRKQLIMLLQDGGISEKDIEKLATQENFQLFIEGYAAIQTKTVTSHIFVRTLFMNRNEFQRMTDAFERLNQSYMASSQRANLIATYKDIIRTYKGGDIDPKQLDQYDLNYFMNLVTSLPKTNNKLFEVKLGNLDNIKKTPDADIEKLKNNFFQMFKRLNEIKKNSTYRLEQDNETFYWVPETVFHIEE